MRQDYMKKVIRILLPLVVILLFPGRPPAHDLPRFESPVVRTLGRVFTKIRSGRAVTVAFLGGSATNGQGIDRPEVASFRALVGQWLRRQYPQSRIDLINAGVPSTGVLYGTLRLRRDLLSFKPDLVLIELTAEDTRQDPRVVAKAVEGVMRQLLVQAEPPEVVLLTTTAPRTDGPTITPRAVAEHYSIPVIDLWPEIDGAIRAGRISPAKLWDRHQELTDSGQFFYAERIIDFLRDQATRPETPIARRLPQPLVSDELNYGEFKVLAEFASGKDWRTERNSGNPHLPTLLAVSDQPGATIEAVFEGTVVGLTWLQGPAAGSFEVLIDGQPAAAPLTRIECYSERPGIGTAIIPGGLALGEHRLTIRLASDQPPRRGKGRKVRLGFLLVGGQRPEKL